MFSTIDGAKKCAKELKRLFDQSGFVFPLNKCQTVVAVAGGYRDWHDLEGALAHARRPVVPDHFRKRLMAALPVPCVPPALAWLDGEPGEAAPDSSTPPRWYRDAFPYLMASAALHRSRTPLLMPGSGAGQRLRQGLVVDLLLNTHGGDRPFPLLEPDTLAFVFRGALEELFRDDFRHPRFEVELETLKEAGILDVLPGRVRVLPPDQEALVVHVERSLANKAQLWGEQGGEAAASALHDALAAIGVRNAMRVADAVSRHGSDAYTTPAGPVLELLSQLAEEGELETFAKAYRLFSTIRPANADFVRESIPAKISSLYLARNRQLNSSKILSWASRNPEWPDTLKAAVGQPAAFAITVDSMATAIAEARP
jgi:hypothetical protein